MTKMPKIIRTWNTYVENKNFLAHQKSNIPGFNYVYPCQLYFKQ